MSEQDSKQLWKGRLLIVAAAVLWSTGGFFAKAPIFETWPTEIRGGLLAFWRAVFASIVLAFLIRKVQWSWKLIPTTLTFAIMNWMFLSALVYNEATFAIWMQYTAPAWVLLFGVFVLREKPIRQDWWMLAFAAVGIVVILSGQIGGTNLVGLLYGVGAGLSFAAVVLTLRWMRDFDSVWIIFSNLFVTALVFSPVMFQQQIFPHGSQWLYLLGFGALQIGIPYVLFTQGLKSVYSHEASTIALLEPILVPVWVFVAWHGAPDYEYPASTTIAGALLILLGLVIRYRIKPDSRSVKH